MIRSDQELDDSYPRFSFGNSKNFPVPLYRGAKKM